MAGGMTGVATFSLFNFGLTGPASPGSILAYFAVTPKGSYWVMLLSIFLSTLVTFIVASAILKFSRDAKTSLADATAKMEATKGKNLVFATHSFKKMKQLQLQLVNRHLQQLTTHYL